MATRSPIPFLDDLLRNLGERLQPPPWAVEEVQRRLVLLLNHVLMQEPQAMDRLRRQAGRVVEGRWRVFTVRFVATPVGLYSLPRSFRICRASSVRPRLIRDFTVPSGRRRRSAIS